MALGAEPMDLVLAERALERGAPLLGLESYEDAVAAFKRIDPEILMESIASTGKLLDAEEDLFQTNMNLYARGEIAAIAELGILLGEREAPEIDHRTLSDQVLAEIIDARNKAWMAPLTELLASGGAFVIVGALHLPGELGLVQLLRGSGFDVSRLD